MTLYQVFGLMSFSVGKAVQSILMKYAKRLGHTFTVWRLFAGRAVDEPVETQGETTGLSTDEKLISLHRFGYLP